MVRSLALTLETLNSSGINSAGRITSDGRLHVWIGDPLKGVCAAAFFSVEEFSEAAEWLASKAVEHYPKSDFAKVRNLVAAADTRAG
jgi:hypothetical protein